MIECLKTEERRIMRTRTQHRARRWSDDGQEYLCWLQKLLEENKRDKDVIADQHELLDLYRGKVLSLQEKNFDSLTADTMGMQEVNESMPRAKVIIGHDDAGNPITRYLQAKTQDELNDRIVMEYIRSGRIAGLMQEQGKQTKETDFAQYAEKWLRTKSEKADNTKRNYRDIIEKQLTPVFGQIPIEEITVDTVQNFLDENADHAKATVKLCMVVLKGILDLAIENRIIEINPAKSKSLVMRSVKENKRTALSSEQMQNIVKEMHKLTPQCQCIVALLMTTALRKSELCALKWSDIDFERNVVRIDRQYDYRNGRKFKPPKNDSRGEVGLPEWAKEVLLKNRNEGTYVLECRRGRPISAGTYEKRIAEIRETIDLYGASSHVLRHSAVTRYFHATKDVSNTQGFARHKNATTTMNVYVSPDSEKVLQSGRYFESLNNYTN